MPTTNFTAGTIVTADWLNDVDDHVFSTETAANVDFLQAGTGAVTRSIQAKERDIVSVKDFGAVGDGTTDDTTAMAAAHATGKLIYYPKGDYKFSRLSASITGGGIVGDGQTQTRLLSTSIDSNDLITFNGASTGGLGNALVFRDFQIQGTLDGSNPAKSAGAAIAISPASSSENSYAEFHNVTVAYVPIGVHFVRASLWKVSNCNLLGYNIAGLKVENRNNHDSGDGGVINSVFNCPYSTGAGILHKSSGGLKITANKFLGGQYGYQLDYDSAPGDAGTGHTGILLITGNSIENQSTAGILFGRSSGTGDFINTTIVGNEFASAPYGIVTDTSGFMTDVTIQSNIFQLPGSGTPYGILMVSVEDISIGGGNVFRQNGGTPKAISLTSCANVKISDDNVYNFPGIDPIELITPGTNCQINLNSQSGSSTTSTSGWSAYGTLFQSASTVVTFDVPFLKTPQTTDVSLGVGSGTGCIGGIIVSVTKTQLTYVALSATTGIAAVVYWQVRGIL